jgi:hypothetical protein
MILRCGKGNGFDRNAVIENVSSVLLQLIFCLFYC